MKLDELAPLDQREAVDPTRSMWYGHPGTGKTVAVAHITKVVDHVLWIEAEPGLKRRALARWDLDMSKIIPVRPPNITYKNLLKLFIQVAQKVEAGESWGVVVDTVTNLQRIMLTHTVDAAVKAKDREEKTKPYLEDYGTNTEELRRLFRQLFDIECHVAITAHVSDDRDKDGKFTGEIVPALTDKFGESLFGLVDMVIYQDIVNGTRIGHWVPTNSRRGKDRDGYMPIIVPSPTFDRIHAYNIGDLTARTDPEYREFRKENKRMIQREMQRAGRTSE